MTLVRTRCHGVLLEFTEYHYHGNEVRTNLNVSSFQNGYECHCGNSYKDMVDGPELESRCTAACTGDSLETCGSDLGASSHNSLYKIGEHQ